MFFKHLKNSSRNEGYAGNDLQTFIMQCVVSSIHKMFKQQLLTF